MAITTDQIKMVLSGQIGTSQTWSLGLWVQVNPSGAWGTQAQLDVAAAAYNGFAATWWTAVKVLCNTTTDWRRTVLYLYQASASTATLTSTSTASGTVAGGTGTNNPPQTCLVASLRTSAPTRRGRGRIYLPATGVSVNSLYQVANASVDVFTNATAAMITSLNAYTSVPAGITSQSVVVRSETAGTSLPVLRVIGDSKFDTQRSRAHKILPTYQKTTTV